MWWAAHACLLACLLPYPCIVVGRSLEAAGKLATYGVVGLLWLGRMMEIRFSEQ